MSTEENTPRNDGVGYGKPPKHSQFKPGQSGNPKGKRKGTQNLATILESEMNAKVTVRDHNGVPRKITKREMIIKKLFADAVSGKASSQKHLLDLMLRFYKPGDGADVNRPLSADEQAFIEFAKSRRQPKN